MRRRSEWVKRFIATGVSLSMLLGAPIADMASVTGLAADVSASEEELAESVEASDEAETTAVNTDMTEGDVTSEDSSKQNEESDETIDSTEAVQQISEEVVQTDDQMPEEAVNEENKTDETVNDEQKEEAVPITGEASTEESTNDTEVTEVSEQANDEGVSGESNEDQTADDDGTDEEYDEEFASVFAVDSEAETVLAVSEDDETEAKKQAALSKQKARAYENGNSNDSAAVNRTSIHDGAILHAFCWNFETITEHMQEIADAGFTAIQTSPINEVIDTHPALTLTGEGQWYYHYQPTDWTIGNYQLGNREQFKALCDKADEYGIGVIVDILPNHTTPATGEISQDMLDAVGGLDNLFHKNNRDGMDYSNRLDVTYKDMGGLPDVDTEDPDFQEYFYAYLEDCINCGADGFRIDTAKHIALPDDDVPTYYADFADRNNFYPNMVEALNEYAKETGKKDYSDLFVYGEVLQGSASRLPAYQQYIGGTTASNYGGTIRSALSKDNFAVSKVSDYGIADEDSYKADPDKLVTWVESHDNYINDTSYASINDQDTLLGWAVITARKDGTPLFFSRPNNSSKDNPFGDNILGATGNDLYKSAEVTAINHFRTDMAGKDEILSNPGNDNHLMLIERKGADEEFAAGAVLINSGAASAVVSGETALADGTYVNAIDGKDDIFTVKDGVLGGVIPAEEIVVLTEKTDAAYTTVHFYNTQNWSVVNAKVNGEDNVISGINENDGWVRFYVAEENFTVEFTDGENTTGTYTVSDGKDSYIAPGSSEIYGSVSETEDALGIKTESVYFFNTLLWEDVKVYSWLDDGTQLAGGWPGKSTTDEGGYWVRADIKMSESIDEPYYVIFNGSGKQTENILIDSDEDIYIALNESKAATKYSSKEEAEEDLGISANMTTVHFFNQDNWDKVYVHMWEAYDTGAWPGIPAEDEGDGWWKITVPAGVGSDFNIIFNDGGNGQQTPNLKVTDLNKRYIANGKNYSSKDVAVSSGEKVKVYYYDDNAWDVVYAYIWGGIESEYNNGIGNWPGTEMVLDETGFYYVEVPLEAATDGGVHIIFNCESSQIGDKILVNDTNLYFNTTDADGYATAEEALGDRTVGDADDENNASEDDKPEVPGEDGTDTNGSEDSSNQGTNDTTKPAEGGNQGSDNASKPAEGGNQGSGDATKPSDNGNAGSSGNGQSAGSETIEIPTEQTPQVSEPEDSSVKKVAVKGVKLNKKTKTLKVGKSVKLKATVKPWNATVKDVTWSSSNKKVAKVSKTGKVTAKRRGTAIIKVKTKDGKFTATCKIKVK